MEPTLKVYVVKTAFEHDGLSYAAGEKYQLSDEVVATLAPDTVELYVEDTPPASTEQGATGLGASAPSTETGNKEAVPAKPWVGGHVVGRE